MIWGTAGSCIIFRLLTVLKHLQRWQKRSSDSVVFNIWTELSLNLERRWDAGLPNELLNIWHQREQLHLWNGEKGIILTESPYKGIFLSLLINHHVMQIPLGHLNICRKFPKILQNVCPSEQIGSFSEEGVKLKEINYFREKGKGRNSRQR